MTFHNFSKIIGYGAAMGIMITAGQFVSSGVLLGIGALVVIMAVANYVEGRTRPE